MTVHATVVVERSALTLSAQIRSAYSAISGYS